MGSTSGSGVGSTSGVGSMGAHSRTSVVKMLLSTVEPSTRVALTCRECVPLTRPDRVMPSLEPGCRSKVFRMPLGSMTPSSKKSTAVPTFAVQNTWTAEQNESASSTMESATTSVSSSLSSSGRTSSGSSVTGSSSSMVVTSSSTSATGANSAAEAASRMVRVTFEVTSPSSSGSSMPPTVTS